MITVGELRMALATLTPDDIVRVDFTNNALSILREQLSLEVNNSKMILYPQTTRIDDFVITLTVDSKSFELGD